MRKLINNQHGDTIVEVLIAASVVSLILVGSFNIANLSLRQIQGAKERNQALKIAESSIERINRIGVPKENLDFCISDVNTYVIFSKNDCIDPTKRFITRIVRKVIGGSTPDRYEVEVKWDGPTGNPENVLIVYRPKI